MHQPLFNRFAAFGGQIGIHQFNDEQAIAFLHRGIEKHRPHAVDEQLLVRKEAGIAVVQAFFTHADRLDIAEAVKQRERIAVLKNAPAFVRGGGSREYVPLFSKLDFVGHILLHCLIHCRVAPAGKRINIFAPFALR